jgi:hypothetical protein
MSVADERALLQQLSPDLVPRFDRLLAAEQAAMDRPAFLPSSFLPSSSASS